MVLIGCNHRSDSARFARRGFDLSMKNLAETTHDLVSWYCFSDARISYNS